MDVEMDTIIYQILRMLLLFVLLILMGTGHRHRHRATLHQMIYSWNTDRYGLYLLLSPVSTTMWIVDHHHQ